MTVKTTEMIDIEINEVKKEYNNCKMRNGDVE